MKTSTLLGHSTFEIKRLGLGCMGMSEFYGTFDEAESIRTLHRALEMGLNFFDTADMYGWGANEQLLGKAFHDRWNQVVLATKFAVMRGPKGEFLGLNGRPEYVRQACDQSLKNLGVDVIDLYYLHRQDPHVPIEETVGAMSELVEAGKVKYLGLSEVDAPTLRKAHRVHPISALQSEFSLWSREPEGAVLETCEELGITFVAYSPLGRGFLTGAIQSRADFEPGDFRLNNPRFTDEALRHNAIFVEILDQMAQRKGLSKAQLALAWLLHQNQTLAVIPGTRNTGRLEENWGALQVELTTAELEEIRSHLPDQTLGARY
ncbi:aldo/keto reductase [bacterium]|nr:aldo/keto reductase [bacterium]